MAKEVFEPGVFKEEIVVVKDGIDITLPLTPITLEDCDEKVFSDVSDKLKGLGKEICGVKDSHQIYRSFLTKKIFVTPK